LIANAGKEVPVIAKIEKHEAIEQMEEILALCDGVMVARGDLGVEMPAEQVPRIQKQLIATANRMGIPIITATQMLDSMVNNPRGTRAEISDVANAILDGTDAVMLSNETAVGIYPIEAVETMARIAIETEKGELSRRWEDKKRSIPNAISEAVGNIAEQLGAAAIIPFTKTGATARSVSKFRPSKPILAVTPHVDVARRLQLVWGVQPMLLLDLANINDNFQAAINMARTSNILHEGDLVVITSGTQGVAGSTDLVKVEVVTAILGKGIGIGSGTGLVTGVAHIARTPRDLANFNKGDILIATTTNAEYLDTIRNASAIVVEDEGLTCHAAVLGLRLDIPVIVGVKDATGSIPGGTVITLDVQRGLIYSGAISFN
jgi:pyruvate kinase